MTTKPAPRRSATAAALALLVAGAALAAGPMSRAEWARFMRSEGRAQAHLCHDEAWLRVCTSEFDDVGGRTRLGRPACERTVTRVVDEALDDGGGDRPVGALFERLPANVGAGYQMDHYAEVLGQLAGDAVLDEIRARGGGELGTPKCLLSKGAAWKIPGNP